MNWGRFIVRGGLAGLGVGVLVMHSAAAPPRGAGAASSRTGPPACMSPCPARSSKRLTTGERVRAGQTIARLENLDLELELTQLEGQRDRQALHLKNLRGNKAPTQPPPPRFRRPKRRSPISRRGWPSAAAIASGSTLTAPRDGTVLPPHTPAAANQSGRASDLDRHAARSAESRRVSRNGHGRLPRRRSRSGSKRRSSSIRPTSIWCASARRCRSTSTSCRARSLEGTISTIGELDLKVAPRELVIAGDLPTRIDESGVPRPLSASYQARVKLDPAAHLSLRTGAPGRAKISVDPQSLAEPADSLSSADV